MWRSGWLCKLFDKLWLSVGCVGLQCAYTCAWLLFRQFVRNHFGLFQHRFCREHLHIGRITVFS
jgi:hypothetical protein